MRQIIGITIVISLAILGLRSAINHSKTLHRLEQSAVASQRGSERVYRLGATLPLTGPAATYGKLIQDGVELALEDLRRSGKNFEIYYEDTPLPGAVAVSAARILVEQRKIDVLVANFFNPVMVAMGPILKQHGIPSFHTAAPDDRVHASSPAVFATTTSIRSEAERMAEYAFHVLQARRAAILYAGTTFGEHYDIHFARHFSLLGGEIIHRELFPLDTTDVRTSVAVVNAKRPDAIVTGSFGPQLGLILRAIADQQLKMPILSTYETEDPSVLEHAGELVDDQVHYFLPEPQTLSDAQAKFRSRFEDRFGYFPRLLAANAYDATMLSAQAFDRCQADRSCISGYLASIKQYPGVSGEFSIDETHAAQKNFVLKVIRGGEFVEK